MGNKPGTMREVGEKLERLEKQIQELAAKIEKLESECLTIGGVAIGEYIGS